MSEASYWYDETYTAKLDEIGQAAGENDGGWNARYRAATVEAGFKLVHYDGKVPLPAENAPSYAPIPVEGELMGWVHPSLIVSEDDETDYNYVEPPAPFVMNIPPDPVQEEAEDVVGQEESGE